MHFNVTQHPTTEWTTRQFREFLACDHPYRFLILCRVGSGCQNTPGGSSDNLGALTGGSSDALTKPRWRRGTKNDLERIGIDCLHSWITTACRGITNNAEHAIKAFARLRNIFWRYKHSQGHAGIFHFAERGPVFGPSTPFAASVHPKGGGAVSNPLIS